MPFLPYSRPLRTCPCILHTASSLLRSWISYPVPACNLYARHCLLLGSCSCAAPHLRPATLSVIVHDLQAHSYIEASRPPHSSSHTSLLSIPTIHFLYSTWPPKNIQVVTGAIYQRGSLTSLSRPYCLASRHNTCCPASTNQRQRPPSPCSPRQAASSFTGPGAFGSCGQTPSPHHIHPLTTNTLAK